ncbi:MAG: hypothetical protein ACRD50_13205 [Candidatus Acidiferrales bacterium]
MSRRCVLRRRYRLFCAELLFLMGCWTLASGQGTAPPRGLYLLAATPTEHSPQTYPAILYSVSAEKKLKMVREVVPQADGVRLVQAWGNAIFVTHPHLITTSVSVIHTDEPLRADDVVFNPHAFDAMSNPHGLFVGDGGVALAEPQPFYIDQLYPLSPDFGDPTKGTLVSVSGEALAGRSRIKFNAWDEYAALRHDGGLGGPAITAGLIGSAEDGNLVITKAGHSTVVDKLPPSLRGKSRKIVPVIVAASREYLVLILQNTAEEVSSGNLGASMEAFVHDRVRDLWKTIQIEGNSSASRLSGAWLTTIVGMWNPDHKPSPGRDNERSQATDRLPNVQELYATYEGRWIWRPGDLILQNLADGRKIRIETGQEDSEILLVEGETVLYRVNDTIYQAKIAGEKLQDSAVVVKDEDVPEIHWVFWH